MWLRAPAWTVHCARIWYSRARAREQKINLAVCEIARAARPTTHWVPETVCLATGDRPPRGAQCAGCRVAEGRRTLRAMVIGAFVRGLSMRDIESLCEKAGLGKLSKSTASRICQELRERFEQFKCRDLYDVRAAGLFLDAVSLSV
jgi:hypothetical protein